MHNNINELNDIADLSKTLNCLIKVEDVINHNELSLEVVINKLLELISKEFNEHNYHHFKIIVGQKSFYLTNYQEHEKKYFYDIKKGEESFGQLILSVNSENKVYQLSVNDDLFFKTFTSRIANFIKFYNIRQEFLDIEQKNVELSEANRPEWSIVLDIIRKTDQNLYSILSRKMLNHLFTRGIRESRDLFKKLGSNLDFDSSTNPFSNRPSKKSVMKQSFKFGFEIYHIASKYFSDEEIMSKIQKWIHEEKSHNLVKLLANLNSNMNDVADAIRKYHHINPDFDGDNTPTGHGIKVAMIRRFLTDSLEFIDIAKNYCEVEDFYNILQKTVFPPESHGKLGGKGAGLFLARKIIEKSNEYNNTLSTIKFPKTWYITSDGLYNFMYYNNMEDVIEQKYKDIEEIRQEYPHVVQAFKNSQFSPEITNGLSRALDDFGDNPIIVRSSSLLEDRIGSAFAGKYKSLFLANQGTKQQKLADLLDAISEVYASTFGPDPIGYRTERGLLDFNEEMGILIQEVVGQKFGKYFFPAFAGVAFSYNEFRWSPRIKREDGLLRLVPGLGTRAVDRVGMDFPVLLSPGNPDLRVNQTFQEVVGYAPKYIDLINLETNTFETVPIKKIIEEVGNKFPLLNEIFSIVDGNHVKRPVGLGIDTKKHDIVVTFDKLVHKKDYIEQIKAMVHELNDKLETPVDIEFACDGKNLYLLQCRPQSSAAESQSALIPKDVPEEKIVFTANKYISNGRIPDIAYIVYVDPDKYKLTKNLDDLIDIGKAVGKLNKKLPKKTFILMGPGRWGSRDDIRLGVKVSYSDIHNTAVLIEIAKIGENYTPELSFGTHFFQDLVESGIKYIPLYPGTNGCIFNEKILLESENTLTRFLPEYEHISDVLRVINVRETFGGNILRILLNADDDNAIAFITDHANVSSFKSGEVHHLSPVSVYDEPLQWRKRMAESIALKIDKERFGVEAVYLFGTVFNDNAGPNSDIDLLVHFEGTEQQKHELQIWFEGWNHCLSQLNYNRSGFSIEKFLDISYISSEDFKEQKYYVDLMDPANKASQKLRLLNDRIG